MSETIFHDVKAGRLLGTVIFRAGLEQGLCNVTNSTSSSWWKVISCVGIGSQCVASVKLEGEVGWLP